MAFGLSIVASEKVLLKITAKSFNLRIFNAIAGTSALLYLKIGDLKRESIVELNDLRALLYSTAAMIKRIHAELLPLGSL